MTHFPSPTPEPGPLDRNFFDPKPSDEKIRGPLRIATLQRLASQLQKMERRSLSGRHLITRHGSEFPDGEYAKETISTGIEALDRLLPDGGFRPGTLTEWLAEWGSGDQLALLAARPALGEDGTLLVLDCEKTFYPPAAAALGFDLRRVILVLPGRSARPAQSDVNPSEKVKSSAEALWALEQSLQSRGVAVTFSWLARLDSRVFRRLQLAAQRGGGLGFLIRPPAARREPSWSDVRLSVESASPAALQQELSRQNLASSGRRWRVEVLRCRRGAAGQQSLLLEYDDATNVVHPAFEPVSEPVAPSSRKRVRA
jgi:protein ImuA